MRLGLASLPTARGRYRTGTFVSVPIEGESGLLGVLNVTDPSSERPFVAEDCQLLLQLAGSVAAAWEQARALEATQRDVEGATRALRNVLRHLERGRRSAPDRVRLARATARELGLPEAEVGLVSYTASIHDVGLTGMSERLREGAGSLSHEQREALSSHPEMAVEMLQPLETLGSVRDAVLTHHEWWDARSWWRRPPAPF